MITYLLVLPWLKHRERLEEEAAKETELRAKVQQPSRLEVNAAIEKLLTLENLRDFKEPAKIIVNFALFLPVASRRSRESVRRKKDGGIFTGYTVEAGDVTFRSDTGGIEESSSGIQRERVGNYRLYRHTKESVVFNHFWKADLTTNIGEYIPQEWMLTFNPDTLEPEDFWKIECRIVSQERIFGTVIEKRKHFAVAITGKPREVLVKSSVIRSR